jgi:GTPase SAR1 family protein
VGKSSFIHAIFTEVNETVSKTLKQVVLPPEMCPYSKEVFTELVDTSSDISFPALSIDIKNTDLILLVYDVSDQDTINRIEDKWLPIICSISSQVSIN